MRKLQIKLVQIKYAVLSSFSNLKPLKVITHFKEKIAVALNISNHIILLSSFLLLIFASCSKSEEDPSIIYNLDDEFIIRPVELLSPTGSKLTLEIASLQEGLCDDSEILYTFRQIDDVSVIELNDITLTENCLPSDRPPSVNISLNSNASKKRLLNVKIKEVIENEGQIDEYPNRYEIRMTSTNGIRVSHRDLYKVQPNTLWGGADYDSSDNVDIAEAFVADLTRMVRARSLLLGYYGQFELLPSGDVEIWNHPKPFDHRSAFAVQSELSLSELSSMVSGYRSQYPNMRFFVYNALGESL